MPLIAASKELSMFELLDNVRKGSLMRSRRTETRFACDRTPSFASISNSCLALSDSIAPKASYRDTVDVARQTAPLGMRIAH
jgi:hypothetical protein